MKIYYADSNLIIVKQPTIKLMLKNNRLCEIWMYNPVTNKFINMKNKSDHNIKNWLTEAGINIKPYAIDVQSAIVSIYRFSSNKDLFKFNLKFGC